MPIRRVVHTLGRMPRGLRASLVAVAAVLLVAAVTLVAFRFGRSGVLPGTTIAGVDVGGLEREALEEALLGAADDETSRPVTVRRVGAGPAREADFELAATGYRFDIEETAETILERGRQTNPFAALADHLRSTFSTIDVDPIEDIDEAQLDRWAERARSGLSDAPFPGGLQIRGTTVTPRHPSPGIEVTEEHLRTEMLSYLRNLDGSQVEVVAASVPAPTDRSDVQAVADDARRALSGTVTLTKGQESLTVSPEELGPMLRTRITDDPDPALVLRVRPKDVTDLVDDPNRFSVDPSDASFEPAGDGVTVIPSTPGSTFSAARVAEQLVKVALSGDRSAEMKGEKVPAEFTTKDAKKLGITEQVSTFTTYHACCEPRVANIHRIADIVDGAIVPPGETFSLNDFVGPRTTDKGFVAAPSIRDGEFVAEVGGGISQFATTFFNAIFFGGYDFLEYQAHSYYISRYPRGREATISTPAPDLRFLNDSDAGIFIDTSYSDTSITVSFFGTNEQDIEAIMGEPFNERPPEEECRTNKDLASGEERTIQSGITGFDVVVKRVFSPSGRVEEFRTHYLSQPRIVERRRCGRS